MSDSKLKGLKDLLWGTSIFLCIAALIVAFFFCAVTRNENERDDRAFAFTNSKPVSSSSSSSAGGLDAFTSETSDDGSESGVFDAEGNIVDEGNEAQYFNAAEYWSAIANGSSDADGGSGANPDGLDA